jgi:DnaJ-class molecular chaperone
MQQPTAKVDWNKKSYYEVLDVPKDANTAQIKKAYYKMARQYHPDQSEDPNADEIFKCINEAYHV